MVKLFITMLFVADFTILTLLDMIMGMVVLRSIINQVSEMWLYYVEKINFNFIQSGHLRNEYW